MRRLGTVLLAAAAVLAGAVALGAGGAGGRTVTAEFASARGLVPGDDVRIAGAVAGSVGSIELTPRGTALVTLSLHDGLEPPRADAVASIQPTNLLGEGYVALSPGASPAELDGTIPLGHTSSAPRLEQVLGALRPSQRQGLQALLVAGGQALEDGGSDLARATVELRPALAALDGTMRELATQRAALAPLVRDAARAAHEARGRGTELAAMVRGTRRAAGAAAADPDALASALHGAPDLLARARRTAGRLADTADAATPVAADAAALAPDLATAARRLGPFLRALPRASSDLRPAVAALRSVLVDGGPTLTRLAGGLAEARTAAPDLDALLAAAVPAAPKIAEGFFVNFADEGAEPGTQPFDPFADPRRNYWRGAAVMSCETFGVPIAPGCLADVLAAGRRPVSAPARARQRAVRRAAPGITRAAKPAPAADSPIRGLLDYLLHP